MKAFITAAAVFALAAGGAPALAQDTKGADILLGALKSMKSDSTPPGQNKRPADPDEGDDNADMRAIDEVCTKDTPAADRSAICPREPASPE